MVRRNLNRVAAIAALILLPGACAIGGGSGSASAPATGYLDARTLDGLSAGFTPSPQALIRAAAPPEAAPGADRWWLATAQAELRAPDAAQHFDCPLGTRLNAQPRPALTRLMNRLAVDAESLTRRMAAAHPRLRPLAVDPTLEPCQRVTDAVRGSAAWPAGGAVIGTAYAEMFAALAPDAAALLRARGRVIGQSRQVCRMNWPGDVADGDRAGQALYASAAATPAFAADLEAARVEVTAARAEGLTNPSCAAERRALGPALD